MRCDIKIIDGRHLLWRASDAFSNLFIERDDGTTVGTGGMYGFLSVLLRIHAKYSGKTIVAWEARDRKTNFRFDLYPQYKDKGKPDPETLEFISDMGQQEKRLMAMLRLMGVRQYWAVDSEADDAIGRLSEIFKLNKVIIYSGDSDLCQLVTDNVTLVSPARHAEDKVYDAEAVFERHGVYPKHIPDLKALAGDNSDNIPGLPGIGPKTAAAAISAMGDVEKIIETAKSGEEWPIAKRFKDVVAKNARNLRLYKLLTTIDRNAGMEFVRPIRDKKRLMEHFAVYRFRSLLAPNELTQFMRMG